MYVRNISTSTMLDTDANEQGEPRFTLDVAWEVAHMLNAQRDATDRAFMAMREARAFVDFLGDGAREHAIDNSLCGNYERFLSVTLGNYRDECKDANSMILGMVEDFVTKATRPRRHVTTVSVPVVRTNIAVGDPDPYDNVPRRTASAIAENGEHEGYTVQPYEATKTESVTETLDYEEAQRVNENFHRRGRYDDASNNDGTCDCGDC